MRVALVHYLHSETSAVKHIGPGIDNFTLSINDRLIKVLNNSELIGENRENYLSIRIYTIDNGTGSAGFESCEVSHNLLIAVSEFDEVLSFCVYNNLNPLFCSF